MARGDRGCFGPHRHELNAPVLRERSTGHASSKRLLATPMTQRKIGGELYVSLNTVKTHTRSIFRKLDAANRSEAVARARDLGIL